MKFEMDIKRKHLLYLVVFTTIVGGIGLGVAYNDGQPTVMGHNFNDVDLPALGAVWAGLNADQVDGLEGAALEESAEIDADIATHAASTDHDNSYVNVGEADSITGAMIQDGAITGADIADESIPASKLEGGGGGGTVKTYKISVSSSTSQSKTHTWTCPAGDVTTIEAPLGTIQWYYKSAQTSNLCSYSVSGSEITIKAYVHEVISGMYDFHYSRESCTGGTCYAHTCAPTLQCVELVEESY
jgi:hypothetical protein